MYDIAIAGGGLGGAALAKSMAEHGVKVLVIEREQRFRDRVRGEFLAPWGYSEAHGLGISDCLHSIGTEIPWMDVYAVTERMVHRELVSTTPQQLPGLAFYHPSMQESLLGAAAGAGATVRRGAAVCEVEVQPGAAKFVVQENGRTETFAARLVVGAEGRSSVVRSSAKFQVARDPEDMMIAGVLFENMRAAEDTFELIYHFGLGQFVGVFPQGRGQVRVYLSYHAGTQPRFQGEADLARFIQGCRNTGANPAYFKDARPIGPLATFDAAHTWVEHPYRDGVALLGDTATSSDPSWGQGLSLTLRDARVLRDHLLSSTDWAAAGHAYAAEHDGYSNRLHTFNQWLGEFYLAMGSEADARRARALPLIGADPSRQPDTTLVGPDMPADEAVRKRFFAEA